MEIKRLEEQSLEKRAKEIMEIGYKEFTAFILTNHHQSAGQLWDYYSHGLYFSYLYSLPYLPLTRTEAV